jgi:Rrf2 family protein
MTISTKGRYGIRLMLELAMANGAKAVSLHDIAQRQDISEKYLWQIIHPLKVAGLVTAARGAHGGYQLSKDPEEITVKDILAILEGSETIVECISHPKVCRRNRTCAARDMWSDIQRKVSEALAGFTLADLASRQSQLQDNGASGYSI